MLPRAVMQSLHAKLKVQRNGFFLWDKKVCGGRGECVVTCSSEMSSYETCQKDQGPESCVEARTCGGVGVRGDQLTGDAWFSHPALSPGRDGDIIGYFLPVQGSGRLGESPGGDPGVSAERNRVLAPSQCTSSAESPPDYEGKSPGAAATCWCHSWQGSSFQKPNKPVTLKTERAWEGQGVVMSTSPTAWLPQAQAGGLACPGEEAQKPATQWNQSGVTQSQIPWGPR